MNNVSHTDIKNALVERFAKKMYSDLVDQIVPPKVIRDTLAAIDAVGKYVDRTKLVELKECYPQAHLEHVSVVDLLKINPKGVDVIPDGRNYFEICIPEISLRQVLELIVGAGCASDSPIYEFLSRDLEMDMSIYNECERRARELALVDKAKEEIWQVCSYTDHDLGPIRDPSLTETLCTAMATRYVESFHS